MPLKLALCLLLLSLVLPAMARDAQMLSANDSGCPVAQDEDGVADAARSDDKRTEPAAAKPRAPLRRGADAEATAIRPPRWHSFLPGMFR